MWVTAELHGGVCNRLFQLSAAAQCASLLHATLVQVPDQDIPCHHATDWIHELVKVPSYSRHDLAQTKPDFTTETVYSKYVKHLNTQKKYSDLIVCRGYGFQKRWATQLQPQMTAFLKKVRAFQRPSAFFHIRQTDYLHQTFFNHLDIQIFTHQKKALSHVVANTVFPMLWVTSDSTLEPWVPLLEQTGLSQEIYEGPSYETFLRMCQCQGGILSNSTFSLWAAQIQEHVWGLQTFQVPSPWFRFQRFHNFIEDFSVWIEASTDERLLWDHQVRIDHEEIFQSHEKLLFGLIGCLVILLVYGIVQMVRKKT